MPTKLIKSLPPNEQAILRAEWRDERRVYDAKMSAKRGMPVEADLAMRLATVWRELSAIVTLLRETADRRPERLTELLLKESLPRLRVARANLRLGSEAEITLGILIETLELVERRGVWR